VTSCIVTLTTDFGLQDSFVGAMKGVLLSRCPSVQIVDLCHDVPPQGVLVGALRLAAAAPFYPPGTVHVAVVDPGVGSTRRPIAIQAGEQVFVGPDNGVLSLAAPRAAEGWRAVVLDRPELWLPQVSHTFHGRDVFAPTAAHLACGRALADVGTEIDDVVQIDLPPVQREGDALGGVVIDVDHFGNLITNIQCTDLGDHAVHTVSLGGATLDKLSSFYDPAEPLVAVISSEGRLEIAVPGGSAAQELGLAAGSPVDVCLRPLP
jgi:S-adenosylmethionine hydrolase